MSSTPFMRCTTCGRTAATWNSFDDNEAWSCPTCEMDESGLEILNPQDLYGTWWRTNRGQEVQLIEWYGNNTFRAKDKFDVCRTVSILSLAQVAPGPG
jgi:hypothetical protein